MKRIWIAAAVLLLLSGLCAGEQQFAGDTANTLAALASRSLTTKDSGELKKYWSNRKKILFAVSHQQLLSDIDKAIDNFNPKEDDCGEKAREIIFLTKSYRESQTPSFSNIF